MTMFYFPRKVYSKATIVKQAMSTDEQRAPQDEHAVKKMNEELFKDFEWDPTSLIPGQLSIGDVPASSMSSLTQTPSLTPSASLSAPFKLADAGSLILPIYIFQSQRQIGTLIQTSRIVSLGGGRVPVKTLKKPMNHK